MHVTRRLTENYVEGLLLVSELLSELPISEEPSGLPISEESVATAGGGAPACVATAGGAGGAVPACCRLSDLGCSFPVRVERIQLNIG